MKTTEVSVEEKNKVIAEWMELIIEDETKNQYPTDAMAKSTFLGMINQIKLIKP